MKALLIFGRFAHDSQGVLAGVHRLAFVGVELLLKIGFGIRTVGFKLGVAPFTYPNDRRRRGFHDPQSALLHECQSSASGREDVTPVEIKRHHYRPFPDDSAVSYLKHTMPRFSIELQERIL